MDAGTTPFVLDVREPNEYEIDRIPGSVLIPLGDLPKRVGELDPSARSSPSASRASARARRRLPARSRASPG